MSKGLKIALAVVAGLVVLVVAGLGIFVATFDAEKYKPELVKAVKDKTGRTLTIGDPLHLSLYPSLGLEIGRVELSEVGSSKTFARIGKLRASVGVLPLLSKQVVLDRIVLTGLAADVVRHKDGSTNIDDLLSGGKDKKESSPSPVKFDVAGVEIGADRLGWRDERDASEMILSKLTLKTGRLGDDVPGKLELNGQVQGNKPKLNVAITLVTGYRFRLDDKAFAFSGLSLKLDGDLPGATGAALELKGDIESDPAKQTLNVKGLELTARTKDGLNARLSLPALSSTQGKTTSQQAEFKFKSEKGGVSVQGQLSTPLSVDMDAKTVQMPKIAGEVSATGALPQPFKLALAGRAEANWEKKTASGNLEGKADASNIKAQFNVNAAEAVPAIGFSLDIDQLDVDRYRPAPAKRGSAAGSAGGGAAEKPMDLSALRGLNLNGQIHAGRLTASKIKLEKLAAALRISGGRLDVNPLSATLYGGTLNGSASIDANGRMTAKKQLSGVNIGPLLRDAIDKDFLEGHGNVALDVESNGLTVTALKRALGGSASVNLRDGAVKGINLAESLRKAKSLLGSGNSKASAQEQGASTGEQTDFSELSASFTIRNGVAHNQDLTLKSPFIRLGGVGDINIGQDSIDYLAKASVVGSAAGQGGKDLGDLRGLTVPVRLTGPYDALKYRIDFAAVATEAVKEKVQEKVKEQLQDQLKGLFKR